MQERSTDCFFSFENSSHSQNEEIFLGFEDEIPFMNLAAASPKILPDVSDYSMDYHLLSPSLKGTTELSTETFDQSQFMFATLFNETIESSSEDSYEFHFQNQELDSSQGSTIPSPGYCSSPDFRHDETRIRGSCQNQVFRVIRGNNQMKVKKNQNLKKKKIGKSSQSTSPSSKQNRMKNYAGLITQRLKTLLTTADKKFFRRIFARLGIELSSNEKLEFLAFVNQYKKDWKTWATVSKYLSTDSKYGPIFKRIIVEFLSARSDEDFEDWLRVGKMNANSKMILRNDKQFFIDGFLSKCSGDIFDEEEYMPKIAKKLKVY